MSKKSHSKHYVSNPISANSVVDIQLEGDCVPETDCPNLNTYLQDIYDKLCQELNLDFHCITPDSNSLEDILQAIINKECGIENCPDCPDDEENPIIDVSQINLCQTSGWDCSSTDTCLTPVISGTEVTIEEIIQSLVSRVLDQSIVIKENCERINTLENQIQDLQTQITNLNCCE